ncbi:DUF3383 family protein [Acetobacter sp.]|uniref:DUF3383 family protein n=1 Tax=Acetobacter sp. TaxID=440 RepID=UPI0039ED2CC2
MSGIPITQVVSVTPGVLSPAGGLDNLVGLILTTNASAVPAGEVKSFSSLASVAVAFGSDSTEYAMAAVYFSGHETAAMTPSTLLFGGFSGAVSSGGNVTMNGSQVTLGGDAVTMGDTTVSSQLTDILQANGGWHGLSLAFEPTLAQKQEIATWIAEQSLTIWGVIWDTDPNALSTSAGASSFGGWLSAQGLDGITAVYKDPAAAALALAWMACLSFNTTNGRQALAFMRNSLVTPSVTDGVTANTLLSNGYSFYGQYANGGDQFEFLRDGAVSGRFLWADSYINQIWLNSNLTSDLINLLLNNGNIPYNTQGDTLVENALQDTFSQALSFGAFRTGVNLSTSQKQQINNAAGNATAADTVITQGYYLKPNISTASSSLRIKRQTPPCQLWYADGQSVQSIQLNSVEVQ